MENITKKMLELDDMLFERLREYGFKKKKKHVFSRKVGECLQHISILETKLKGKAEVHISVCVGFTYEKINKVISFIQNEKYDKKWATANINIASLMESRKPYGFYVSEETNLEPIIQDLVHNIEEYSLSFLDTCDNLEKYEKMLIEMDEKVRNSTYTLKRPEWNLLALSILLNHNEYEEVLEDYKEDFKKNLSLMQVAKEKIKKFDVVKESDLL
jgi:hypothetical protein